MGAAAAVLSVRNSMPSWTHPPRSHRLRLRRLHQLQLGGQPLARVALRHAELQPFVGGGQEKGVNGAAGTAGCQAPAPGAVQVDWMPPQVA